VSVAHDIWAGVWWLTGRIKLRWKEVVSFAIAFRLVNWVLLAPLSAIILRSFLTRWGRASVGNFEVVSFLLSPTGLLAIIVVGAISLATLYLELAGLMRLLDNERVTWWQALTGPATHYPRLVWLGIRQLILYLLILTPFLLGIGALYFVLWRGRDLNGLLVLKPPVFWLGGALAGALLAVYSVIAGRLFLKWILALPIILFDSGVTVRQALARSSERTNQRLKEIAKAVGTWAVAQTLLTTAIVVLLKYFSAWVLQQSGSSLAWAVPVTAALLTLHGFALAGLSVIGTVSFAGLVLTLYRQSGLRREEPEPIQVRTGPRTLITAPRLIIGSLLTLIVLTIRGMHSSLDSLELQDQLQITAHRAGAANAPENSVAALRRAIIDRADWAEIDVQRTKDDAIIVLHDTDLARVGGGKRQVGQTTLQEIQQFDIGKLQGPEFAGERIPTFDAFLEAARNQPIGLTVELKPHGKDDEEPLTRLAIAAIRRAGMLDQCRLCSQSYESLMIARRLEPGLKVGWIGANALGDLTKLNVDFLMLKTDLCTEQLVERATLQGMAVHAWTVNDPGWIPRLLDREVENVITDDPVLIRERLDEIRRLDTVDRLILRARSALLD